jgi:putative membrane-bound dehydrogenase-like protein
MDLIAHEPLVTSPVAIAYDENGNLYVAEMLDFPNPENTNEKPQGRIRLLKDTDGDGSFDTSSIFVDGLRSPSSIACWKGGIFVCTWGDIWYFKDENDRGEANVRTKVFTGFGLGAIEYMENGLVWGIDHKIYGSSGPAGGSVRMLNHPDAKPVSLAGRDFCFDPVKGELEPVSGGGSQWGNSFDDWYNRFVCKNIVPARHVVFPLHYLARDPNLGVPRLFNPLTSEAGDVPVYRASPPEPWRTVRAHQRQQLGKNANPGEINEAGYFTAACAINVYRGNAYPASYHGNLFIAEPAGNLVHRRALDPEGVTFLSRRVDDKVEVVASSDIFFRPVNFVNAPDGTLHIVDMYREVVEDPVYVPAELIKAGQVNVAGGRERGRIYRLAPPDFNVPRPPRLGTANTTELVAQLENPNSWWRETAQRLIYERQDPTAIDPLRKLTAHSRSPLARLHALWSLDGLQGLRDSDIAGALIDSSAGVREHAVRLAERAFLRDPELVTRVLPLASDPAARVRFQVALTIGEAVSAPSGARSAAERGRRAGPMLDAAISGLARIAESDASDAWIRTAVLSSSAQCADKLFEALLQKPAFLRSEGAMALLKHLAFTTGTMNKPEKVSHALSAIAAIANPHVQISAIVALGEGLTQSQNDLFSRLIRDPSTSDGEALKRLMASAQMIAPDSDAPADARADAITLLGYGRFENVKELAAVLDVRQPQEVQLAVVRALAQQKQPDVAPLLLSRWRNSPPAVQTEIVNVLLARDEWIGPFLDAAQAQEISAAIIGSTRRSSLLKNPDLSIRDRATALFGDAAAAPRNEVIDRYKQSLSLPGRHERGQQVFERVCVACHRFRDMGNDIGPHLSAYGQPATSSEKLLISILDPNRDVSPEYIGYGVSLTDGRVLTGIVAAQTPNSITLKQPGNSADTVILRKEIEEMTSSNLSLMPEGLEQSIKPEEMADLLAFLLAIRGGI